MLSIIIPVYQAVKTIGYCVESIVTQEIGDYEIILVDDGSTDGSSEECDRIAAKYNHVRVIHELNKGPFLARATGAKNSIGDTITFVDADDWLDEASYKDLIEMFAENDVDVLLFDYKNYPSGEIIRNEYPKGVYDKSRIVEEVIPNMMWDISVGRRRMSPSVCCMFVKRGIYLDVVKNIDKKIVWGEDAAVKYPIICAAEKIMISDAAPMNYRITDDSCIRTISYDRIEELRTFRKVLLDNLIRYTDYDFKFNVDCYTRTFLDDLMGVWFECERSSIMFAFPYDLVERGERIKLYGAGDVGKSYYAAIKLDKYVFLDGWYDTYSDGTKKFDGEKILRIGDVTVDGNERILVAINNENIYREIKKSLLNRGVSEDRILWRKPIKIG